MTKHVLHKCWFLIASLEWFSELVAIELREKYFLSRLHMIKYRLFVEQRLLARSVTLIVSLFRLLLYLEVSSIRAEARLPEISICAGVVTVCLIWHGAAYVRNKSSRVQCRCPHRKPIVYADLTWVVCSPRLGERYLFRATRFASYLFISGQMAWSEASLSMREEKRYILFNYLL